MFLFDPGSFTLSLLIGILLLSSYPYIPTFYNNKIIGRNCFWWQQYVLSSPDTRCLYCGQNYLGMRTNSPLSLFFLPLRSACFCLLSLPKLYKCLAYMFIAVWESDIKRLISFPALPADLTLSKVCLDHLSVSKPDSKL